MDDDARRGRRLLQAIAIVLAVVIGGAWLFFTVANDLRRGELKALQQEIGGGRR